jgi:putative ABC transport system substrate-binding protein
MQRVTLKETGGKNISIEFRVGDGHYNRLPMLAVALVGRDEAEIFAYDVPSAKEATKTIPVVFAGGADPVKMGASSKAEVNRIATS